MALRIGDQVDLGAILNPRLGSEDNNSDVHRAIDDRTR